MSRIALPSLLLIAAVAPAQQEFFAAAEAPITDWNVRLCFNGADGRILALANRSDSAVLETWELQDSEWHLRVVPHAPPSVVDGMMAMAYDSARRVVVLCTGEETWEWDSLDWKRRSSQHSPPSRLVTGLAYDTQRQRTVLFGGIGGGVFLADQWEWDGTDWIQITVTGAAPPPSAAPMAYDEIRGRLVLCSANPAGTTLSVYEYDGQNWSHPLANPAPPGLRSHSATWDAGRGRVVVCGGRSGILPSVTNTTMWEWDGSQWQSPVSTSALGERLNAGMAYDTAQQQLVVHGGSNSGETWRFDESSNTWSVAHDEPTYIQQVANDWNDHSYVVDLTETYRYDHAARHWQRLLPATQLPIASTLGFAFDTARQRGVLLRMGGTGVHTWEWNPSIGDWSQLAITSPPPVTGGAFAYDPGTGRVVYLEGSPSLANLTWTFDGIQWTALTPATSPPPRISGAMTFDFLTGGLVLFGGLDSGSSMLDDVWDWNGVTWSQRAMNNAGPGGRIQHALMTRPDAVILAGGMKRIAGTGGTVPCNDVWELRGSQWTQAASGELPALSYVAGAGNVGRGEVAVFGGNRSSGSPTRGPWIYSARRAATRPIGGGCGGAGGRPGLAAIGLPTLGNASFQLRAHGFDAQQPAAFMFGFATMLLNLGECRVFVAPDAIFVGGTTANGVASDPFPIPATPALVGVVVNAQAAAIAVAAPGFATSQALRIEIGM
jgi:hypothetical protein